jgi:cytochrome P450
VSGTPIAPNTEVLLLLGSANRDEERFADADRFDVSRIKRDHLGFGGGAHACIGAMLAMTEAVDAIDALLAAFPVQRAVRPLAEVPRSTGWHVRGVKELLVDVGR